MNTNPNLIIDSLGGTCAVAKICDVSAQAVSQWRVNGIPKPWLMFFKEKRPDLFYKKQKKAT